MPKPATVPAPPITALKKDGLALVTPLQDEVQALQIKTAEDYLLADELLGRVRSARSRWALKMSTILTPLKNAVSEAKKALKGSEVLHAEIDDPLAAMETGLKDAMRDYKLEEQRQLHAAEEARQAETQRLREEAQRKQLAEAKAKTAPMRERLAQARQRLEEQVQAAEEAPAPAPVVKGASSVSRKVPKWRVVDMQAFVAAAAAHVCPQYKGRPVPLGMLLVNTVEMNALFKADPARVATFPGVEVYEDIVIAGR